MENKNENLINLKNISFVKYDLEFLNCSWIWLNDKEIRALVDCKPFTKEEQLSWYNNLKNKKNYFIKGIKYNNNPIGVIGLRNITKIDAEYFGYIGEKDYWNKGIGKLMLEFIVNYSKDINLQTLYLNVLHTNLRAIKLYEKCNFQIDKEESSELKYLMYKNLN